MLAQKGGGALPGWRDLERAVATVFDGEAQENKSVFDVLVPVPSNQHIKFGVSCKMRRELDRVDKTGRVAFELSNSAGKFWGYLRRQGLNQKNYRRNPLLVGSALLDLVRQWHTEVSLEQGGLVDLSRSFYLVLSWNRAGWYQLYQFSIHLPEPKSLKWGFHTRKCLRGDDHAGTLFEWYGESGGQLKYYPLVKNAIWSSARFQLEPIKRSGRRDASTKTADYFPELWARACRQP